MKKLLSIVLSLALCLSLAPALGTAVRAEEDVPGASLDLDAAGTVYAAPGAEDLTLYVASYDPVSGRFLGLVQPGETVPKGTVSLRGIQTSSGNLPVCLPTEVLAVSGGTADGGGRRYERAIVTDSAAGKVTLRNLDVHILEIFGGTELELGEGCDVYSVVINVPNLAVTGNTNDLTLASARETAPKVTVNGDPAAVGVTRARAAELLAKAVDLDTVHAEADYGVFADCAALSAAQRGAVAAAAQAKLVNGTGANTFEPHGALLRSEALVLVSRLRSALPEINIDPLASSGATEQNWYDPYVKKLWRAGVLTQEDLPGGQFQDGIASGEDLSRWISGVLDAPLTRAEAAELLVSTYPFVPSETDEETFEERTGFTDCGALTDAQRGHILAGFERGLFSGTSSTGFTPFGVLKREMGAVIIAQALYGGTLPDAMSTTLPYTDVSSNHWAYPYLAALWNTGILTEADAIDGCFLPGEFLDAATLRGWLNAPLTRVGAAMMLTQLYGLEATHTVNDYYDDCDELSDVQKTAVVAATEARITAGMTQRAFAPQLTVDRAQAAVMAGRLFTELPENVSDAMPFTDVPEAAWYYNSINTLWKAGAVNALDGEDGRFRPADSAMAFTLSNWLEAVLAVLLPISTYQYCILFAPWESGSVLPIQANEGDRVELPVPTWKGHAFLGWYDGDGVRYGASLTVTGNLNLHAQWMELNYSRVVKGTLTTYSSTNVTVNGSRYNLALTEETTPVSAPLNSALGKECILYMDAYYKVLLIVLLGS